MTVMRFMPFFAALMVISAVQPAAAEGGTLDAELLARLSRVSDPQLSPDDRWLVYVMRETDIAANKGRTDLWLLDLKAKGATPQRLAADAANDGNPRWSADGKAIYFLSKRSGSSQVWRLAIGAEAPEQVTDLPLDVADLVVSPDGTHIAFTMRVFQDCDSLACTTDRLTAAKQQNATGTAYSRLFVRHWDTWEDGRRTHLFVQELDAAGKASGAPTDVSASLDGDVAAAPFGSTADITFTADGASLIFAARLAAPSEAWSTNYDLFRVAAAGGTPENLTSDNSAYDGRPTVSRNGRWLAYLAMARPGYESDRQRIVVMDLSNGTKRVVTGNWDRSVSSLAFLSNGAAMLIATAQDLGQTRLWAIDVRSGAATRLTGDGTVVSFSLGKNDIAYVRRDLGAPEDIYMTRADGRRAQRLTTANAALLDGVKMAAYEQFSFPGWNGETVNGYVMKPADFMDGVKFPVAFIIHGGPQSSFGNNWSYRWNPQVYAGAGFAVVFIDFHGSTGYGQGFTDSITGDWGGKPLTDLKTGLQAATERFPFLSAEHVCALGASYGGYMINWIAGNWADRFECLVNHDGIFDMRSMYYSTEELWFVEHDHGGPYFDNADAHERDNPANHVTAWRTPMLVVHGGQDFRVPLSQSLSAFTALQRQGIPSRFLYFPDENHWVQAPANSIQWHQEVLDWLRQWLND